MQAMFYDRLLGKASKATSEQNPVTDLDQDAPIIDSMGSLEEWSGGRGLTGDEEAWPGPGLEDAVSSSRGNTGDVGGSVAGPASPPLLSALTAEERDVLRWARNSSSISAPRGMDSLQYKKATAIEVLVAGETQLNVGWILFVCIPHPCKRSALFIFSSCAACSPTFDGPSSLRAVHGALDCL